MKQTILKLNKKEFDLALIFMYLVTLFVIMDMVLTISVLLNGGYEQNVLAYSKWFFALIAIFYSSYFITFKIALKRGKEYFEMFIILSALLVGSRVILFVHNFINLVRL